MSAYDPHDEFPWRYVILGVVVVAMLFFWYRSMQDCRARGGALVEAGVWYECVARAPFEIKPHEVQP